MVVMSVWLSMDKLYKDLGFFTDTLSEELLNQIWIRVGEELWFTSRNSETLTGEEVKSVVDFTP